MAKTYRQIFDEFGKVPPEQSIQDEKDLIAEIGFDAYWEEYDKVAKEKAHERFTRP
ncbi:MAG: hypothetical protein IKC03_10615 [Oscillospiraceae bacterium]|nr:hypothetical protein [Oscillospiraceae bacterium]